MFKNHPKGLVAASLSNMGERFGFYVMMAILLFFLQDKFNLSGTDAGLIYSMFYFLIYALAFVGGLIADKTQNYKGTICWGIILKIVGHLMIAYPTVTPVVNQTFSLGLICTGLFTIALGSGLFKGNLQALVGQMYDNEKYVKMRDSGFSLFYMFINVGAVFAPLIAIYVRNTWVSLKGFAYHEGLPKMCHDFLDGSIAPEAKLKFTEIANGMMANADLTTFANEYLNVFNTGYHYAFAVTIIANLISLWIYQANRKNFPDPAAAAKARAEAGNSANAVPALSAAETKQRIWALMAVFSVVIFFWFSFHQNGVTLNMFARDYTDLTFFGNSISPEFFQSFNPFFVIFLTPVVLAVFGYLRSRGKEPTTAGKIAIGMAISGFAFLLMTVSSLLADLPLYSEVQAAGGSNVKITPWLLVSVYFILTISELFISPMGISFVTKVSPPKYQGLMQGGWLTACAIGNLCLFLAAVMYEKGEIWITWTVLFAVCVASMLLMLVMKKWLDRVAG